MPGPPPKREAERRRRNKDGVQTVTVDLDSLIAADVEIPVPPVTFTKVNADAPPDRDDLELNDEGDLGYYHCAWHPIAEEAYWSLSRSGQAIFMEPSDWSTAMALCEMLSRELKPKPVVVQVGEGETEVQWIISPVNGAVMNAFLKGWASLMATEGDRRKLRIELERKKAKDAAAAGGNVTSISKTRRAGFKKASQAG